MRQMSIALAVLKQGDNYLLQRRGQIPKIGGSGLIGLFGGKIESGETALEAVCRELPEETNLTVKAEEVKHIGEVDVTSDHNLEKVVINAQIFEVNIDSEQKVAAKEGELVTLTKDQAFEQLSSMTTGTAACFRQLIGDE